MCLFICLNDGEITSSKVKPVSGTTQGPRNLVPNLSIKNYFCFLNLYFLFKVLAQTEYSDTIKQYRLKISNITDQIKLLTYIFMKGTIFYLYEWSLTRITNGPYIYTSKVHRQNTFFKSFVFTNFNTKFKINYEKMYLYYWL